MPVSLPRHANLVKARCLAGPGEGVLAGATIGIGSVLLDAGRDCGQRLAAWHSVASIMAYASRLAWDAFDGFPTIRVIGSSRTGN